MDRVHPEVLAYYERGGEETRLSEADGHHPEWRLEFWRTQDVLRRTLPAPPARVLDVGGGSGVHAAWLTADGYQVELLDPVPLHVGLTREKGIAAREGDARHLPYDDGLFDAVLLLGPLYHLPERADRVRALAEARRVARPGGVVTAAVIGRWAALHDGLLRGYTYDPARWPRAQGILSAGHHPAGLGDFTEAYFHRPDEIPGEFADAGLGEPVLRGLEGVAWLVRDMSARLDDPESRGAVLRALRAVETEPALLGASSHVLGTATVPGR